MLLFLQKLLLAYLKTLSRAMSLITFKIICRYYFQPGTLTPAGLIHRTGLRCCGGRSKEGDKVRPLAMAHEFVPVAIETMGTWGARGLAFINELGRRIA